MCRSWRELSNAYLLEKIGVDTAENEPLEVWGENSIQYSIVSLGLTADGCCDRSYGPQGAESCWDQIFTFARCSEPDLWRGGGWGGGFFLIRQTLESSFSAVSKPNFARKYSLESSRRDLHTALLCTVLESNPKKRGKPWREKILVQSRENRPGEAHRQPQLSTQYYPRARTGIKAV